MSFRRILSALAVVLLSPLVSVISAGASSPTTTPYSCARVPMSVPAGRGFAVSTTLDGSTVHFVAPSSTPIPTPYGGVPGDGRLTVATGSTTTPTSLRLPTQFSGTALITLCLVPDGASPAVLVETYSGGAHCCVDTILFDRPSSRQPYRIALLEALSENALSSGPSRIPYDPNQGLSLRSLHGQSLFFGGDGNFPYTFGCYACTPSPLVISALEGGRLVDVSSHYPALIRRDAGTLWSDVLASTSTSGGYASLFGSLSAWVADECVLARGSAAWREVETMNSEGFLSDARYHEAIFSPKGSFLPDLDHFLLTHGYCRGQIPVKVG